MGLDYRVRCCPDGLMTDRRRDVRVLDCTIRDGGCTNLWQFPEPLVQRTFEALVAAGVDVMEVGYFTSARALGGTCLLYTSPSPRDQRGSRMPSSA